ncbi:hypothetical protein Sste5346_007683 [Sporothrix stenoceras]|uniref:Transcription initiation factor TFIID subunit 8 n=1 Tax=Sporothrix stenoceras TaxID=5173 RepID=A0ABR3YUA7_9PEZI
MADASREASVASRKRPSPAADDEYGAKRANSDDRSDSAMTLNGSSSHQSKRPRTASPKKEAGGDDDDDPYAFPDDTQFRKDSDVAKRIQSKSISPLIPKAKPPVVVKVKSSPSPVTLREDSTMADRSPAPTGIKTIVKSGAPTRTDTKSERKTDSTSGTPAVNSRRDVNTVMGGTDESEQPSIGEKKPPTKSDAAPFPAPDIKLRQPQKLKRLREQHEKEEEEVEQLSRTKKEPSENEEARQGLRRALVLALDHVGFSSATNEALESFLLMTESYFQSLVEDVTRFSLAARRTQPIPVDFDTSLARFNIGKSALRPHLRNPIDPSKLAQRPLPEPQPEAQHHQLSQRPLERRDSEYADLPLLSDALSGRPEKESKSYIPSSFPAFPSIHTYRNTPIDVDTVTVHGTGLRYDDGSMLLLPSEEASAEDRDLGLGYAPLLDGTVRSSDPKRIREAAAVEAKQAEEALRGLMRASKVNKLKEVRAAADRSSLNKTRYSLWEAAMRELIVEAKQNPRKGGAAAGLGAAADSQSVNSSPSKVAKSAAAALREEIADQSMMVNAEKMFHRKEIPRKARKIV